MSKLVCNAAILASILAASTVASAQTAPTGPRPRIWLDATTLATMQAQSNVSSSGTAKSIDLCRQARTTRQAELDSLGGTFSFAWGFAAAACGLSYQVTGNSEDATTALRYFRALLDDQYDVGDGAGGDDVVTHDTGYVMRNVPPYAALVYDWLHDAPGMTEELRAHARARFAAWTDWYRDSGYLQEIPGANYNAGYVYAATLIAIAQGGDAGAEGDALWQHVVNDLFGTVLARGLTDAPADINHDLGPGGTMIGGDWPEGWQYGPLSVLEYALATRAVEEQGFPQPEMDQWAGELVVRHVYASNPARTGIWPGGDCDNEWNWMEANPWTLLATVAGTASPTAKAWARAELDRIGSGQESPVFEALADAIEGPSTEFPADAATNAFMQGTGTFFVRDKWGPDAIWAMFRSGPATVPDHQHPDAGNWVLSRGGDDLVVDPSPYGGRSTLTSNAPAVDSDLLIEHANNREYTPSQTPWNFGSRMVWHRATTGGIVVARADYGDAFRFADYGSDVPVALRDWVMVPYDGNASVVLIDRVVTEDASRALHLRIRTGAQLTLSADALSAIGTVGSSDIAVQTLWLSSGSPSVRTVPRGSCDSAPTHGSCENARFRADEYSIDIAGPEASAIELVHATATGETPPESTLITGDGYRGVVFHTTEHQYAVIGTDAPDAQPGSVLEYEVPAGTVNIVVDAPVGPELRADVTSTESAGGCLLSVTPHSGDSGGYEAQPLIVNVAADCAISDEGTPAPDFEFTEPGGVDPTGGSGGQANTGGAPNSGGQTPDTGGQSTNTGGQPTNTGGQTASSGGAANTGGGASASTGGRVNTGGAANSSGDETGGSDATNAGAPDSGDTSTGGRTGVRFAPSASGATSDAGDAGNDGVAGGAGAASADDAAEDGGGESGCLCSVPGRQPFQGGPGVLLALASMAVLGLRRRRQQG